MPKYPKARRYPRVELGVDSAILSEIWRGQIGSGEPTGGVVTVLGAGGAFIEMSEPYDVGTQIGLRFTLPGPGEEEIACDAVVRHREPGRGIGVEFTTISAIDRERVRAAAWSLV